MADIKNPFELLDAGDENADPEQIAAAKKVTAAKPAAAPVATKATFHAKFAASCNPVLSPWPPAGLWMCAASPANNTRPLQWTYEDTVLV